MTRRILVALLLLVPALAIGQETAPAGQRLEQLAEEARGLFKRGPFRPDPDRLRELRSRLARIPREELTDDDWIDLHVLTAEVDRRLDPMPAWRFPARPAAELLSGIPAPSLLADPVALIDAASRLHALRSPPGTAPPSRGERELYRDAARRAEMFAVSARAIELTEDDLVATAAAVAGEIARELAAELDGRSRGRFPVGRERFEWLLTRRHGLTRTADEVREFGEEAVRRCLEDLDDHARRAGGGRTWQDLVEVARDAHPATNEEHLEHCRRATREAVEVAVASGLLTVPEYARQPGVEMGSAGFPAPYAHYRPGRSDKRGIYRGRAMYTPVDEDLTPEARVPRLRDRDPHLFRVICPHEAVPGHHLQYAVASRVRSPVRHYGHNSSFVEGWGLYSEELMERMGFYEDPLTKLAFLRMRLWRAVRVVVDVGLHTGEMTRGEAVAMLTDVVRLERWAAGQEVARYLGMPTQPLSYMVGYERIRIARRAFVATQGPESEREFHDRLLGFGPIPLDLAAAVLLGKRRAYDLAHP